MFMKKFLVVISAIIVICSMNFCEAAKKMVAVMPPENVSNYQEQKISDIMTEQLIVAIHSSGIYTVVERAQIGAVLKEQGFQNVAGDPNKAVEFGKLNGADYTLVGKITIADNKKNPLSDTFSTIAQLGKIFGAQGFDVKDENLRNSAKSEFKISLELRFIDNATGEIVVATTVEGNQQGDNEIEAMNAACKDAAKNFLSKLQKLNPFVARIADISGEDIYIDKGFDSGLSNGEILVISREIAPITVNGKIVGMKSEKIGRAQVVEVNAEYSVCRLIEQFYMVKPGDILKREVT